MSKTETLRVYSPADFDSPRRPPGPWPWMALIAICLVFAWWGQQIIHSGPSTSPSTPPSPITSSSFEAQETQVAISASLLTEVQAMSVKLNTPVPTATTTPKATPTPKPGLPVCSSASDWQTCRLFPPTATPRPPTPRPQACPEQVAEPITCIKVPD